MAAVTIGFTTVNFLINLLCAVAPDSCIPYNPQVKPEPQVRSSRNYPTQNEPPVVLTSSGYVEGYYMKTIRSRSIAAFEGIPYAKPPIGNLRFRAPVPIDPWPDVKKTTTPGTICLQMDQVQYFRVYGHEDCLFLNIYVPDLAMKDLPIMFFIHGGAHTSGTGRFYGPAYLLDKQDVILVTFNYRVGILGYFTTGDSASPGNFGMKDQALALHWVQKNAQAFGGDPTRITVIGQSSGAVSSGLHLISHKTRHIPWAGILHSGHPLHQWAILNRTYESSKIVAKSFECPLEDSEAMVTCMRSQNPYFVVEHQWKAYKTRFFPLILFGPVVEAPSEEAFLIESPEMSYQNGNVSNVPILLGLVPNEGDFIAAVGFIQQIYGQFRKEWVKVGPIILDFDIDNYSPEDINSTAIYLRNFYFPNNLTFDFWTRHLISQVMGDRFLANGVRKAFEWHPKAARTFGYIFNYRGKYSSMESLGMNRDDWGVSHADDLQYLFNCSFFFKPLKTTDKDFQMVEFVTNVWVNFAAKRKPVFTNTEGVDVEFWEPISKTGDLKILDINSHKKMVPYPFEERYKFWKSLGLHDDFVNPRFEKPYYVRPRSNRINS